MENYTDIFYRDHPHFTVGKVDQWGEQGFLFYENHIYEYDEDRKEQYGRTYNKMTIDEFLKLSSERELEVPNSFMDLLKIAD